MHRRHYLIFAVLVVVGLVGSLMLVTGGDELALIRLRDKDFDSALSDYEARLRAGDLSAAVVRPLCQLYLQYGNVGEAISLMERFVRANPSDALARAELGRYYQYDQRNTEYFETLEELARLDPAEDTLRRLAEIYNFRGESDQQITVIRRIVELYPGRPQDLRDLADLLAARDRLTEAAAAIEALHARHPEAQIDETVLFLLSVLLDDGQHGPAVQKAQSWLASHPSARLAVRLASLLNFKGQSRPALAMLEPFAAAAASDPEVLTELTQLEIANGLRERALDRLDRLEVLGTLPLSSLDTYLDLLLTSGRTGAALDVAMRHDLTATPPWVLVSLTSAAVAAGRLDVVDQLFNRLGDGFLEQAPVLGAHLSLARGDRAGAMRWVEAAESGTLAPDEAMGLAQVYVTLGRHADAIGLLRPLAHDPTTPEEVVVDLATLYLAGDAFEEGFEVFESLREERPSPAIESHWALLAARAGRVDQAISWLGALPADEPSDQVLDDLWFLASDGALRPLAVMAAERRWARARGPARRLDLASALVAADRVADALPHFRALLTGGAAEVEAGYLNALQVAFEAGHPVGSELREYWQNRLAAAGLDEATRNEVVYALLDLEVYDAPLPVLADLARRDPGQWIFAYADTAIKAGRTGELVAFLREALDADPDVSETAETRLSLLREHGGDEAALPYLQRFAEVRGGDWAAAYEEVLSRLGRRTELVAFWRTFSTGRDASADERRGIAFRSLEAGEKLVAESILLDLAADAPPDSPDVMQLLFVWGPRPQLPGLDWLEARARAATSEAREGWLRHLIDVGEPRRAVAAAGGEFSTAYVDAVVAAGDRQALAALVAGTSASPRVAELRTIGDAALQLGDTGAVRQVYQQVLEVLPDDPDALRHVGALDYGESRVAEAKARLGRYLAGGGTDPVSDFYYGEILDRERDAAAARVHFERVLASIERQESPDIELRGIQALALHRLGRDDEAFALFEGLLGSQPANLHVRGDYAAALMQSTRFDEAQRVLDGP